MLYFWTQVSTTEEISNSHSQIGLILSSDLTDKMKDLFGYEIVLGKTGYAMQLLK